MQIARLFLKPRPKLVIGQSSQDQRTTAGPLEPQAQRLSSKKDTFSHPHGLDRVFCNPIRPHRTRVHSIPEAKFCVISRGGRRGVQREPRGASFLATPTFRGPSRWLPVEPTSVASVRPHKKVQPSHITQRGWGGGGSAYKTTTNLQRRPMHTTITTTTPLVRGISDLRIVLSWYLRISLAIANDRTQKRSNSSPHQ